MAFRHFRIKLTALASCRWRWRRTGSRKLHQQSYPKASHTGPQKHRVNPFVDPQEETSSEVILVGAKADYPVPGLKIGYGGHFHPRPWFAWVLPRITLKSNLPGFRASAFWMIDWMKYRPSASLASQIFSPSRLP